MLIRLLAVPEGVTDKRLQERLAGYDYDRHIGGHLYLYLRGMEGPDALQDDGQAFGVYTDLWPKAVVLALDAALAAQEVP